MLALQRKSSQVAVLERADSDEDPGGASSASIEKLQAMQAHGFTMPWVCVQCSFSNTSYPSFCEICNATNPVYHAVLAKMGEGGDAKDGRT